jgi:uncharacterized protein (DUF433 family)
VSEAAAPVCGTRRPVPFVSISPAMRCGAPCLNNTRLPVSAIAGMLWAEKSVAAVCDEYDISRADVLIACWYVGMYGSYENRRWRRRWRGWAEQVHGDLWKVTTVDYDAVPDPPLGDSPPPAAEPDRPAATLADVLDADGNLPDLCGRCVHLPTTTGWKRAPQVGCPVHGAMPTAAGRATPPNHEGV